MGEAKRRGSKAERAVEAQMRDAIPTAIQDLISRLGLPSGSRFLGYVVHVPSTDDYLANVDAMGGMVRRAYTPSPAHAQVFHDFHNAVSAAKEVPKEAIVGLFFDTGPQYRVIFELPEGFDELKQQFEASPHVDH